MEGFVQYHSCLQANEIPTFFANESWVKWDKGVLKGHGHKPINEPHLLSKGRPMLY